MPGPRVIWHSKYVIWRCRSSKNNSNSSEKSVYTHCCGHDLALVICTACKLVMIRNALDTVKDTCMMFVRGSKKMSVLRDVVKENPYFSEHKKTIFDICVTWWVKNLDGYNMILIIYRFIIEALQVMALKLHLENYPEWSWVNFVIFVFWLYGP